MMEEIVGVIAAIMTRGLKGDLQCRLVFTSERLIVALRGMLGQIASGLGALGAFGAIGGIAYWAAQKKSNPKLGELSPDDILGSNKKNFSISYGDLKQLETGRKMGTSRLYIRTSNDVYKFKFQGITLEQVEEAIRSFLPSGPALVRNDKLD